MLLKHSHFRQPGTEEKDLTCDGTVTFTNVPFRGRNNECQRKVQINHLFADLQVARSVHARPSLPH